MFACVILILSTKDVPFSTVLLKKEIDVYYCLKELYSILPDGVIKAMLDREAIKLVLGNQLEAKLPRVVADYNSIKGHKSTYSMALERK